MKSSIIFYSFSGNTRKVAHSLRDELSFKGQADLVDIQAIDESKNFFGQCARAFLKKKALIKGESYNLTGSDLVCIGTPVWAFEPTPAIRTFLENCYGLEKKSVILFSTHGSGAGVGKCFREMERLLLPKRPKEIKTFSIQQGKVENKQFLKAEIIIALSSLSGINV